MGVALAVGGCGGGRSAIVTDTTIRWEYYDKTLTSDLRPFAEGGSGSSLSRQISDATSALAAATDDAAKDAAQKRLAELQAKLANAQSELDEAKVNVDNDSSIPPLPYPDAIDQVHSSLSPPPDLERAFAIVVARCQAAEREKTRSLSTYTGLKWPMLHPRSGVRIDRDDNGRSQ